MAKKVESLNKKLLAAAVSATKASDIKKLIEEGAEVNCHNEWGLSPVMLSAQYNHCVAITKALIDAGSLVPDEIVEGMIESEFRTVKGVAGFLLDGFPRTTAQATALDGMLAKKSEEVTAVVSIMIPDEMIKERIKHRASIEGRADDANDETIANRIRTYHDKTEPLVGYYKEKGKYHEIDGTGTIEQVRQSIFDTMDKF